MDNETVGEDRSFGAEENRSGGGRRILYADVVEELLRAARRREEDSYALLEGEKGTGEVTGFSNFQFPRRLRGFHRSVFGAIEHRSGGAFSPEDSGIESIAGFFVGRHGGGARLTREAARLHLSLFNLPDQVVLVADPEAWTVGLYVRDDSGRFADATFQVVYRSKHEEKT